MARETFQEEYTITALESTHMTESRRTIYTACEDFNFHWDMQQVRLFRALWLEGKHIADIAIELGRHQAEVLILAIDQAEKGLIGPRQGGIFGGCT